MTAAVAVSFATDSRQAAAATSRPPGTAVDVVRTVNDEARVQQRAAASDGAATGMVYDGATRTLTVYRKASGDGPYVVGRRGNGLTVRVRRAAMTEAQTRGLLDEVWADRALLRRAGIDVRSAESRFDGTVTIGVAAPSQAARSALVRRYGRYGNATVEVVRAAGRPVALSTDRFADGAPFMAGERIVSATGTDRFGKTYTARCSSGWSGRARNDGSRWLVTAYHCIKPSDHRMWTATRTTTSGGFFIGTATVVDRAHDLAYIKTGSTTPQTFDGTLTNQFRKTVIGTIKPYTGQPVCTSGATSGVVCYATVTTGGWRAAQTSQWGETYAAWLWSADQNSSGGIVAGGDSGAPVFQPSGSYVYAVGVAVQGDAETTTCTHGDAALLNRGRCYGTVRFADAETELSTNHNLSLVQ